MRTRTGQTGRSAYMYEIAALQNAYAELDRRRAALADAIEADVSGSDAEVCRVSIASPRFPDATMPAPASHIAHLVRFNLLDGALDVVATLPSGWTPSRQRAIDAEADTVPEWRADADDREER